MRGSPQNTASAFTWAVAGFIHENQPFAVMNDPPVEVATYNSSKLRGVQTIPSIVSWLARTRCREADSALGHSLGQATQLPAGGTRAIRGM